MFRKPTIADIYVDQVHSRLDDAWVPVYSPSTPAIEVGTIGRFEDGAFKRRGHLDKILGGRDAYRDLVPLAEPTEPGTFWFRSEGNVSLEPTGKVEVLGQELLSARLAFQGKRAVVASFVGLVEWAVDDPRSFDDLLWRLYVEGELEPDEVVGLVAPPCGVRHYSGEPVGIGRRRGVGRLSSRRWPHLVRGTRRWRQVRCRLVRVGAGDW